MEGEGNTKTSLQKHSEDSRRIAKYALMVIALAIVALALYLIPKSGSTNCSSILIGQSKDNCILALATTTNNATLCSSLPSQSAQQCYVQIAQATGRYQLCGNVSAYSQAQGDDCYMYFANKTNNVHICSYVSAPSNYQCLLKVAIDTQDASYCSAIYNGTQFTICNDSIGFDKKLELANASYCSALNGTYSGTEVLGLLGSVKGGSGASIGSIGTGSLYFSAYPNFTYSKSDICYYFLSQLGKSSYCNDINSTIVKDLCIYSAGQSFNSTASANVTKANATNSSSYYASLLSQCSLAGNFTPTCTNSVLLSEALQTRNTTICSQLGSLVSTECFDGLASKYQNQTYCSYISNSSQRYSCTLEVYGNYSIG